MRRTVADWWTGTSGDSVGTRIGQALGAVILVGVVLVLASLIVVATIHGLRWAWGLL